MGKLTDNRIRDLKPTGTPHEIADSQSKGLYLWVGRSGAKSFVVRFRIKGKPKKLTLGRVEALSLAEAREQAAAAMSKVAKGLDPAAEKQVTKRKQREAEADTFEAIATDYLRRDVGLTIDAGELIDHGKMKLRSGRNIFNMLKQHAFPEIGDTQITLLKKSEIIRMLDKVEEGSGPVAADRLLASVRRVLNWHAERSDDYRPPHLKLTARKQASESKRDRVLDENELRVVWKIAGEMDGPFGALVRFLLLTGARRTEASGLRWDEINGADGTSWLLPKARNKVKVDLVRPLSAMALGLLNKQPRIAKCPFVFTYNGRHAIAGFAKPKRIFDQMVLAELRKQDPNAAPLPQWQLHDLRRTARTLMSDAGVPSEHAERCLGHVIRGVEGVYNRHKYLAEMQIAYDKLARRIVEIVEPLPDKVVPLKASH